MKKKLKTDIEVVYKKLAKKMRQDRFVGALDDLIAFTGLSEKDVCRHIVNSGEKVRKEFKFVDPHGEVELKLFYRCCREYLFLNAYREVWPLLKKTKLVGPVLDFAGGMGNDVVWLANDGYLKIDYHEISIIQKEFMQFRILEHGYIPIVIVDQPLGLYNTILLRDVLEHVPNPSALIKRMAAHLHPGGLILEHTPWNNKDRHSPLHFTEQIPLKKIFANHGFKKVDEGVWRKNG